MENRRANFAAWLSTKQSPLQVGPAPYTPPRADEIVVRVGDRVLGHAAGTDPKRNSAAEGSFQTYTVLLERMASPIPALDPPSLSPKPNGKTLLVWGGSTSVGSNALQLAVAAGYEVFTTASPRNFDYCTRLGARRVFDYNDRQVVRQLIEALSGKTLAGALAIGAGSPEACAAVVGACTGTKFVSMATFPVAFTQPLGQKVPLLSTVAGFLWFSVRFWLKTRPRGIRSKFIFGTTLVDNEVGPVVYADFLPQALAQRRFVAAPEPRVVGTGLGSIQSALELQRKGVSARKIVVSLPSGDAP